MTETPGPEQGQPEGESVPPPPPPLYDPSGEQPPPPQEGWAPPPPPEQQGWAPPPPPEQQYAQQQYAQPAYGAPQPAYAGAPVQGYDPNAPYGIHPATGIPYSDKSKLIAGLLQIFVSGVGRMYIGQVGMGVAQLLVAIFTCGIGALWSIIDGIMILVNDAPKDAQGRILKQ